MARRKASSSGNNASMACRAAGNALGSETSTPRLVGHGNPGALLPQKLPYWAAAWSGQAPLRKVQGDIFTVALEEEEGMGPAQVHEIPQGVQAAGGFLQNIPPGPAECRRWKTRTFFQQAL